MFDLSVISISLQFAFLSTLILVIIGIPLAFWLSETVSRLKPIVQASVALPLVLPPSVLGFYLLRLLSPEGFVGKSIESVLGTRLVFTFQGIVLCSVLFGLPFMVLPIQSALQSLSRSYAEAAYTLGKSKIETALYVLLPNIKTTLVAACVLTFSHALGEFGVVMMVGGNIPKQTRVLSIAIYDEVQAMNYPAAHLYSLVLVLVSLVALGLIYSQMPKRRSND